MICLICRQAETVDGETSVKFERGKFRVVVNRVPAQICPSCQEAYLDEEVVVKLVRDAQEMSESGSASLVREYTLTKK